MARNPKLGDVRYRVKGKRRNCYEVCWFAGGKWQRYIWVDNQFAAAVQRDKLRGLLRIVIREARETRDE